MIRIPSLGYVVMSANGIAIITGTMILSNGSRMGDPVDIFHQLVPEDISIFTTPLVVLGITTIVLTVCGILTVIIERWLKCSYLILVHAFLLGILVAFQIYVTVAINKSVDNAVMSVPDGLNTAFADPALRPVFHDLELKYMCCGTLGSDSYDSNQQAIPISCCQLFQVVIIPVCTQANSHGGCIDVVSNVLDGWTALFPAFLLSSAILHIFTIILSLFYFHQIKSKRYD